MTNSNANSFIYGGIQGFVMAFFLFGAVSRYESDRMQVRKSETEIVQIDCNKDGRKDIVYSHEGKPYDVLIATTNGYVTKERAKKELEDALKREDEIKRSKLEKQLTNLEIK